MKVRKAVIPAAGFGTRFLPVTRSIPKVMIPVLDKPAIHYVVEEAALAGIEHIVFVITHGQEAVGRYFDRIPELEHTLERRGEFSILEQMLAISDMAEISYVYQKQQLGLGHAVLTAKAAIGHEPFAVFLPDDLILSESPTIGPMIDVFSKYEASVVAVKLVPDHQVANLGIVDHRPIGQDLSEIVDMIEKPVVEEAPSNLAIIGRYVLTPQVFDEIENSPPGVLGEIQLTDSIRALLSKQKAYGYKFPGVHFDVGTPVGLLKASLHAALQRDDISDQIRDWMQTYNSDN